MRGDSRDSRGVRAFDQNLPVPNLIIKIAGSTPVHQDLVATSFQGRDDTGTENRTPDATLYEGESRCEIVDKDLRAVIEEDRWRRDSTPKASTKT